MSHSVVHEAVFAERNIFTRAIGRVRGQVLGEGRHELYDGAYNGLGFTLPNWSYPLVLQHDNRLVFDDFGGKWGNRADIDRLKQMYQTELAIDEFQGVGHVTESVMEDGSIKLEVLLGGGTSTQDGGAMSTPGGTILE